MSYDIINIAAVETTTTTTDEPMVRFAVSSGFSPCECWSRDLIPASSRWGENALVLGRADWAWDDSSRWVIYDPYQNRLFSLAKGEEAWEGIDIDPEEDEDFILDGYGEVLNRVKALFSANPEPTYGELLAALKK